MLERPQPCHAICGKSGDLCCINANKIFDQARDKDCLEDLRVHVPDCMQEVIDRATAVRTKEVEIADASISLESVPFNRGFYSVTVRYYFCLTLECCLCSGRTQEVRGICAFDKKIILFGSEKNAVVFTSDPANNSFCPQPRDISCHSEPTLPTVTVEVAPPIALDTKLVDRCRPFGHCCMAADAIPDRLRERFEGNFLEGMGARMVFVTLGMFSVIRMERPVALMLPACDYCLPERDSTPCGSTDPCGVFGKMTFPVDEFFPYPARAGDNSPRSGEREDRPCR